MIEQAEKHLQKHWGYPSFRPDQKRVIESVLAKKDTLALLPTGGGKSICYQASGLCFNGVIVVISPLIALMNDQVETLKSKGISAVAIHSGMRYKELDHTLESAVHNAYKFVYVSPERAQTQIFIERFKAMNVDLLAIDESHCISQWGFDFRPSYLKLLELRKYHPEVPILALTASATQKVKNDIVSYLDLKNHNEIVGNFERPNLSYYFIESDNKANKIAQILQKVNASGIVYTYTRKDAKEFSNWLNAQGISAGTYHGGMTNEQREKARLSWMQNTPLIMCATNAFGMGIDKPDVRTVVHHSLPLTIEAYYQEAGRAGRDGSKAYAIVVYNKSELTDLKFRLQADYPEIDVIKRVYLGLANFYQLPIGGGIDTAHPFNITDFCKRFNMKPITVFSAIKFLEKEGYVSLSEAARTPSRMHVTATQQELYNIQLGNKTLGKTIEVLLRSYSGLFDDFGTINEMAIAQRLQVPRQTVVGHFKQLHEMEAIEYREQSETPWITFTEEIIAQNNLRISPEVYHHQKELAFYRLKALTQLVLDKNTCRNTLILRYFDVATEKDCGICDVCMRKKAVTTTSDFETKSTQIKALLLNGKSITEVLKSFPENQQKHTMEVYNYLIDFNLI